MEQTDTGKNLIWPLAGLAMLSVSGAAVYLFYGLNWYGVVAAWLIAALGLAAAKKIFRLQFVRFNFAWRDISWPLVAVYLAAAAAALYLLWAGRSGQALVSPWQTVSPLFFAAYAAATAALCLILYRQPSAWLPLISLHYFLSLGAALIVYRLGYGFDPFIHQAAVNFIDRHGFIIPKTIYYAGQYSLVVIIHKLTTLPLDWLDKLLVPLATALIAPAVIWQAAKKIIAHEPTARLLVLAVLILPLSFFVVTTPQNLAYLLALAVILLTFGTRAGVDFFLLYLLALTAILCQPIAGLPTLLFVLAKHLHHGNRFKNKEFFYALIFVLNIILLPGAFYLLEKAYNPQLNLLFEFRPPQFAWPELNFPNEGGIWLNFVYFVGDNRAWLVLLLAAAGIYFYWRERTKHGDGALYAGQTVALLAAWAAAKILPFSFLINYERNNYADRLLYLALFFSLPFLLMALGRLITAILKQNNWQRWAWLALGTAAVTASVYLAYPRRDLYFNSHNYATSETDLAAVDWIAADTQSLNFDYAVLANQQVSAAALRRAGFAKYHRDNIFYYPIPTGGELYQYYLEMMRKPSRQTITAAATLTGVKRVYLVVNSYWWQADKIISQTRALADDWQIIDNGKIYIFKFSL